MKWLALLILCGSARADEQVMDPYEEPQDPYKKIEGQAPVLDPYAGADFSKPPTPGQSSPISGPQGNDIKYKVLFKFNLNYQHDDASLTGEKPYALRGNLGSGIDPQAAALASRADQMTSDHVLGTEGLGWKHLRLYYNGYLFSRFESHQETQPVFPTAYLRGGQQVFYDVRSGYGEINGFRNKGFWSNVFVRAGRQFRYGAGIATFDGITLGYQGPKGELIVWGGRRSPRFLDDADPGYTIGVDGALHLDPLVRVPIDLSANYLLHLAPQDNGTLSIRHLFLLTGQYRLPTGGKILLSFSSYGQSDGGPSAASTATASTALSSLRMNVAFSHPLGRPALLRVYYDLKYGRDLVYDFVSGFSMAPSRYFTLPDQENRSRFGVRVDHGIGKHFEYCVFGNFNIVHGADTLAGAGGWTGPTAFDATYEELGAILRALAGLGFQAELEYRVRIVQRADEANGLFSETSLAGERQYQEVRGDFQFRPAKGLSLRSGAVFRWYDFGSRYAPTGEVKTVLNDFRGAGVFGVEYVIKRYGLLRARYEVGRESSVFAPELGVVHTLMLTAGGRL